MPFLSPNQQCQSSAGNDYYYRFHYHYYRSITAARFYRPETVKIKQPKSSSCCRYIVLYFVSQEMIEQKKLRLKQLQEVTGSDSE